MGKGPRVQSARGTLRRGARTRPRCPPGVGGGRRRRQVRRGREKRVEKRRLPAEESGCGESGAAGDCRPTAHSRRVSACTPAVYLCPPTDAALHSQPAANSSLAMPCRSHRPWAARRRISIWRQRAPLAPPSPKVSHCSLSHVDFPCHAFESLHVSGIELTDMWRIPSSFFKPAQEQKFLNFTI